MCISMFVCKYVCMYVSEAVETPLLRAGCGSSLVMPQLSCKLKTKKTRPQPTGNYSSHQLDQLCLVIVTAYKSLPHCFCKNIVTAFDLDCSIVVSGIQPQIILGGAKPCHNYFYRGCSPLAPLLWYVCLSFHTHVSKALESKYSLYTRNEHSEGLSQRAVRT